MKFLEEEKKAINDKDSLGIVFITLGLEGTLFSNDITGLKAEMENGIQKAVAEGQANDRIRRIKKVYFGKMDALLDSTAMGPQWLRKYDMAKLVINEVEAVNSSLANVICYTVMPNHVHLMFDPVEKFNETRIAEIIENLKLQTREKANAILGTAGDFWINDHHLYIVYNQKELINIISYILENPVKAGLVDYWRDWPWSYCNPEYI